MKKNHFLDVIKLGTPLLAGMFAEYLMTISDTVMVGRLGIEYLAAVAIGGLVTEILWAFAWTLSPAVQTLVSRRCGAGDDFPMSFTGQVFNAGIIFSLVAGIIVLAVSYFAYPVLSILIKGKTSLNLSMEYIRIIRWSIPISGLYYAIYGFLAGTKYTKHVMYATVGMNALNILLNYVLIFGKFGFPPMGISGAAWGTLISTIAGLLYFILLSGLSPALKKFKLFSFGNIPRALYLDIARTWFPLSLQHIFAFAVFLIYEGIISRFGVVHLAVIHIVLSIYWLGKTIVSGFADSAAILVGHSLGEGNKKEALLYSYTGIFLGIGISTLIYLLTMLKPELLISVFNSEQEIIEAGRLGLRFFAVFILIGSVSHVVETIFSHNGWSKFVLAADIISNIGLTFGFTLIASNIFHASLKTIWTGYALYLLAFSAVLWGGFYSMRWTKIKIDSGVL